MIFELGIWSLGSKGFPFLTSSKHYLQVIDHLSYSYANCMCFLKHILNDLGNQADQVLKIKFYLILSKNLIFQEMVFNYFQIHKVRYMRSFIWVICVWSAQQEKTLNIWLETWSLGSKWFWFVVSPKQILHVTGPLSYSYVFFEEVRAQSVPLGLILPINIP